MTMPTSTSFQCRSRHLARVLCLVAVGFLAGSMFAKEPAPPAGTPAKDEFSRMVKLAPFVVRGQQLSVSIHARTGRDRRYAEEFSEEVLKVIYESGVSDSTGKGLVIIGAKGEPHPIRFFRQFLALAEAGKLDPAVAARGQELHAAIEHWQIRSERGRGGKSGLRIEKEKGENGEVDLEFEKIVTALPLPLDGIGAQLYQLAWFEQFDDAKVEAKLRALRAVDLERDLFAHYDWVFYLPARGVFEKVIDDIIAEALKEEDLGFFARAAVKSVLFVVKPKIRKAIEGARRGLLFDCVVRTRTKFDEDDISEFTSAYIEQHIPGEHDNAGSEHERAVRAVRAALKHAQENTAKNAAGNAAENAPTPAASTEKQEPAH